MPIIPNCNQPNPMGAALPAAPVAAAAPNLAPAQGDHVFGDVVGVIGNALAAVFGGGANWPQRMAAYNATLAELWNGLTQVDLGHAAHGAPVVARAGAPEQDQHAHMFGGYANRLQWQIAEIVCAGYANGAEVRRVGGATTAWRNAVLGALDDLLTVLVDDTALRAYIPNPNAIRQAAAGVVHPPISLATATATAAALNGPGRANVQAILTRYGSLRGSVDGLLRRFDGPVKQLNPANNSWA